jgi:predicted  nucleic acid-binding Zn-ribbon protein
MALTSCGECGKQVSTTAEACPHCGFQRKQARKPVGCAAAIGIVFLVAITVGTLSTCREDRERQQIADAEAARRARMTPDQRAADDKARASTEAEKRRKDEAVNRAATYAHALRTAARDPDKFKLESAIVIDDTGAVCYDFRTANALGGLERLHAVLSRDGKRFSVTGEKSFAALWAQECTGKKGSDAGPAIRWHSF